jgi:methyl-accepting chemotaxis protein
METAQSATGAQKYRRRMRNYLLDVGLQLRYTMTIVIVAVFLTAGLGFKMYQATRDISKVIELSGMADPTVAGELQGQFASSDKWVLWGIIGFGVVLVISISAVGILITHKVAGPLFKITSFFARVRDNRLGVIPAKLRKGDELQDFYSSFREMHQALRAKVQEDVRVLGDTLSALESAGGSVGQTAVEDLRQLKRRKEESLENGMELSSSIIRDVHPDRR